MMADKEQQLQPPNEYERIDEEAQAMERRKKRMKCLSYVVAFAVFQTAIILIFALTIMKIKTPKFRVRSTTFETFAVNASNPSFNLKMIAELGVKNTNFGHYKYDNATVTFYYRGLPVGSAFVPKARAKARATKEFNVTVELSSASVNSNSALVSDINSRILPLTSTAKLTGKVELMKVMKKKKSTNMNCTMEIHIATSDIRNLNCK
ncbi:late embryogenesis abundant protein At1g64065-like [Cornus florida]|uniref:late embryogenesis abundant protein At1g64065-like n=1 Tax=Cornus florida TaxID=4283 RepID=UPI00289D2D3A|nr:late embryogenesis abundant protein At1g64065-like [Cornus florida]